MIELSYFAASGGKTLTPSAQEITSRACHLQYCPTRDQYSQGEGPDIVVTPGWKSLTNEVNNIQRKEESDWKMVYLARSEGVPTASIFWKWDFTG